MSKIDIDSILLVLKDNGIEQEKLKKITTELEKVAEDKKDSRATNATPKAKQQYVILALDEENKLKDMNLVGFCIQIPDGDDTATVLTKIKDATKDFNENTRKGKKSPVKSLSDCALYVSRKFTKRQGVHFKHREFVRIITTDGKIM